MSFRDTISFLQFVIIVGWAGLAIFGGVSGASWAQFFNDSRVIPYLLVTVLLIIIVDIWYGLETLLRLVRQRTVIPQIPERAQPFTRLLVGTVIVAKLLVSLLILVLVLVLLLK